MVKDTAMAGTRKFDTDQVLQRSLNAFWHHGYDGTSIQDLTDATGLGRGSLYGAFRDKETLFLAALDRYLNQSGERWAAALAQSDIRRALRDGLTIFIETVTQTDAGCGCFLVLASMGSDERGIRIRRHVQRAFAQQEQALYDRFRQAEADGQLAPDADPLALARFFVAQSRAIGATARVTGDVSALHQIADLAMVVLGPAPTQAAKTL